MDRRNFLIALFALPFAAKPLGTIVGFSHTRDVDWPEELWEHLYANGERVRANAEEIRRYTEALLRHAPTGWRVNRARYSADDVRAFRKALRKRKAPPWT